MRLDQRRRRRRRVSAQIPIEQYLPRHHNPIDTRPNTRLSCKRALQQPEQLLLLRPRQPVRHQHKDHVEASERRRQGPAETVGAGQGAGVDDARAAEGAVVGGGGGGGEEPAGEAVEAEGVAAGEQDGAVERGGWSSGDGGGGGGEGWGRVSVGLFADDAVVGGEGGGEGEGGDCGEEVEFGGCFFVV